MTTLLLLRHGESRANELGLYAGHGDFELSEKGKKQAELTAEFVTSHYMPDQIYASDLKRAAQTASATAKRLNLPVIHTKELREIFAGDWEGMPFERLMSDFETDYGMWLNDIGNAACTGGESVSEMADRMMAVLKKIAESNDGKTVLVATHATPIRAAQCIAMGKPIKEMNDVPWVTNASVTELMYDGGQWSLGKVCMDEQLAELKTALPKNV